MNVSEALRALAEISSGQWGMVTTSQANSQDVSRVQIARLAESGHLERLAHGVYRDAGSSPHEFDDIRAAWLSLDPDRVAEDRVRDAETGIVVSGNTAAALHGVGDLLPTPYVFTSPTRRQSQRPDIRFKRRPLAADQITLVAGIPTTGIERTIADLVQDKEDLSLVGDLVGDALRSGTVQLDFLAALLNPLAARNGFPKDDGLALLRKLLELGRVDVATQIKRVISNPAWLSATSPDDATMPSEALAMPIERSQSVTSGDDMRSVQALVKDVNVLQNLATQKQASDAG
ncbi:MAG: type IV toxin-antitoxin system AbiEi family antitoxin domain-containing protein [Rhodoglobus sp.]